MNNIEKIRSDFPVLSEKVNGKDLIYFDNGATTLKPKCVSDVIEDYNQRETANIHRGVHTLSELSTTKYEKTREVIKAFINAKSEKEIIFTSGTTGSINLISHVFAQANLNSDSEVLITEMEHHSNIVPWQMACERTGATLRFIPMNESGDLILDNIDSLINEKTKIVSFNAISNALGTINPIKEIINKAKSVGAKTMVDAAQAVAHMKIDVQELDCDFLAFSGHKLFGPTGIGVLYGKENELNNLPPFFGGGDMIDQVSMEKTTYNELPYKFEAGTPNISAVIGLGRAIEYFQKLPLAELVAHEDKLLEYATSEISKIKGVRVVGTANKKASILSFVIEGLHPHDIGTFLNEEGIAIRTGHHCAQPIMKKMNVPATARASFAFYNTKEEIDKFITTVKKVVELFT